MPESLAVCIEDLDPPAGGVRYLRCTAVPGRRPGLRVDGRGTVLWREDREVACELWVSADDRLILYRPAGAVAVEVRRGGRHLDVPFEKPVVLLDQDCFDVGGRRLRIHVHGVTAVVRPPEPLPAGRSAPARIPRVAAAVAMGAAALGGTACPRTEPGPVEPPPIVEPADAGDPVEPIDVRVHPPAPPLPEDYQPVPPPPEPPDPPPIDVRENPPDMAID